MTNARTAHHADANAGRADRTVLGEASDFSQRTFAPELALRQIPEMSKVRNPTDNSTTGLPPHDDASVGAFHGGSAEVGARDPKWIWLIGALAVATASLGFRVAMGMFLVSPLSDQYIAGYAFREFAAQSLHSGRGFPQWNPFLFGGMPYVAAMHGDIFYPTFLLRLLMPIDLAITWGFVIHLFLAGVFTVGFLRTIGLSRWVAAFGGLSYMMSGPIASYASPGHDGQLFVSALLPLALWMLTRAIRDERLYAWGIFAFAVGLAALSSHPQVLQYFLLTCGAFAVYLVYLVYLVWDNSAVGRSALSHTRAREPFANANSAIARAVPTVVMDANATLAHDVSTVVMDANATIAHDVSTAVVDANATIAHDVPTVVVDANATIVRAVPNEVVDADATIVRAVPNAVVDANVEKARKVPIMFVHTKFAKARFAVTRLGAALTMALLGLGIGAIQFWPVLGYMSSSSRAAGKGYEFATNNSLPPEELFNTYLPQFSGMLTRYWGRNGTHLHSEYLGIALLMLVPLAFGSGGRNTLARFWLGLALIALLWALGGFTPFFHVVYALVPGTQFFRAPSTIIYVLTFALSVLSAMGFERVLARKARPRFIRRYVIGWIACASIIAALGTSGMLTGVAKTLSHDVARNRGDDPKGFAEFVASNQSALAKGSLRSLAVVVVVGLLLWAFYERKLTATRFATLLFVTCGADLWSIAHTYWRFSQPAAVLYASDPILRYLQVQSQPGRVLVYTKTADHRAPVDPYFGTRGLGEGAGFMVHGIRSITGYHGNEIARFDNLSSNGATVTPAFWRHENVRWMYSNADIADSVLHKVNGPTPNSAGSTSYLYDLPGENSYAWVGASFGTRDDIAAAKEVLREDYNPHVFVSVAPGTEIDGQPVHVAPALPSEPSTIKTAVSDFAAGRATIQLDAPSEHGNVLVISENYYKGWRAVADGKMLSVMRASYNLVGVPLPVGTRTVAFTFQDERYRTGRLVTLIALALTSLLTALGWHVRRPR